MNFVGLIPARGGSKGISRKNVRSFCGAPLIAHTIRAACGAHRLTEVWVSTEDDEIASISTGYGAMVLHRDPRLATDQATAFSVIEDAYQRLPNADAIVYLQPTSPLRTCVHIHEALEIFAGAGFSSLVSVTPVPHCFSAHKQLIVEGDLVRPLLLNEHSTANRETLPSTYARNGPAILVTTRSTIEQGSIYGERVGFYAMEARDSVDIDDPTDFAIAEFLMKARVADRVSGPRR